MIPSSDPKAGYVAHRVEIDAAIKGVLESGSYILGNEVRSFEEEFARYLGTKHGVGVASGTDALVLALRACGVGAGDAVITVSHTSVATIVAIELTGATPVVVDINPKTLDIDSEKLTRALEAIGRDPSILMKKRLKAVIPVHLYGNPADMREICKIAAEHGLKVVEDCAQAHGSEMGGRKVGSWGDVGAFSFYPTKNLGALGDGGLVVTGDEGLAEQVRLLRQYGWKERFVSLVPGMNSRLDELQAAVLRIKLKYLDEENDKRRGLARVYCELLKQTSAIMPETQPDGRHVFHQFVIRTPGRDELKTELAASGIGTQIHYPLPVHLQPAYEGRIIRLDSLQGAEEAARTVLSLPMYPELKEEQVQFVGKTVVQRLT
jgi:dTDP-4-amino-4,6-dideoxygalactose transaminase